MYNSLNWEKINNFLYECGKIHEPVDFSKRILIEINNLIPFEQARLYFINDNSKVYSEHLLGVDETIVKDYHEYFSKMDNSRYGITKVAENFKMNYPKVEDCVYSWDKYNQKDDFFNKYVIPNQIRHSFGLGLRDLHNSLKCLFIFDRVNDIKYSNKEILIMSQIRPHLDNLHKNFYVETPINKNNIHSDIYTDLPLTSREIEIAELLIGGVLPANISSKLFISITTVNKHIANIHRKLNVSTRQELIIKLLNNR